MRPVIAITADHDRERSRYVLPMGYVHAIEQAGGVPVVVPYLHPYRSIDAVLDRVDGVLLTGGDDADPAAWGEAWHPQAVPVDPAREAFERDLACRLAERRMPTLGICFGMQLMSLARGGTMHQFLPDMEGLLEHRRLELEWNRRHAVTIDEASVYAQRLGQSRIVTNSSHKQAVAKVGAGLQVLAKADDGVVEGVWDPQLPFFVGVQWHPERQCDEWEHLLLFELLIEFASRAK